MCQCSADMNENGKADGMEKKKKKKSKKFDKTEKLSHLSLMEADDQDDEIDSSIANSLQNIYHKEGKSKKKKKHSDKALPNLLTSEKQESGNCNGDEFNRHGKHMTSEVDMNRTSTTHGTDNLPLTRIKEKTDSESKGKTEIQNGTEERKKKKKEKHQSETVVLAVPSSSVQKTSHSSSSIQSSSSSSLLSSSKTDFDFFKGILSTIPASALASYEIPESDSDDEVKENSGRKRKKKDHGKKVEKKQRGNVQNRQSSQTKPQDNQEEEPYSKVKEKQKHKNKNKNKNKNKKTKLVDDAELDRAPDRRQLLQQKLEARIQELRAKRKLSPEEQIERKRLKRKESKMKMKMRRKAEKLSKSSTNTNSANENKAEETVAMAISSKPSLVDKGGKLVFSKFDFSESGKSEKKKSKSGLVGKDYKRLLEKIEKRNEKINSLKETDAEKAKKVEEKTVWKTAMLKAEGERVKDDVKLLKKSLKTKEKQKSKRKKKWKERENQVKKRQDQRQEKRQKHIKERKQTVIDKKIKKAKKKGRLLPGF